MTVLGPKLLSSFSWWLGYMLIHGNSHTFGSLQL
jgi:hypothetical protein